MNPPPPPDLPADSETPLDAIPKADRDEITGDGDASRHLRAVFLTAGAAGMYCGSCMHDNALARTLRARGLDCLLQPVYTPIRTDEPSVAGARVFFGGIHIYLLQRWPWLRRVPAPLRRWLDWPPLIRLATRRVAATNPARLAELTLSMLRGRQGRQAEEVARLVGWLRDDVRPHAVLLTNLLIGGVVPSIREALPRTRIVVILQGDDIFLDYLPEAARGEAVRLCQRLAESVDCFVVNSRFYRDKMAELFAIPHEKFTIVPLSIDAQPFADTAMPSVGPSVGPSPEHLAGLARSESEFRIGYLARVSPEKGLHHLVEAFLRLVSRPGHESTTLHVAGWLGETHREYLGGLRRRVEAAGYGDRFVYHGSPSLAGKIAFLRSLDVLSVPTEYADPKGLFVLESLAAGVPVIQPGHGAFPELIESTCGGLLFPPGDLDALCEAIDRLRANPQLRRELATAGRERLAQVHAIEAAAERMETLLRCGPVPFSPGSRR